MSKQPKSRGIPVAKDRTVNPAIVASTELLGPAKELRIRHDGREYRLRLTQNNRLLLTAE